MFDCNKYFAEQHKKIEENKRKEDEFYNEQIEKYWPEEHKPRNKIKAIVKVDGCKCKKVEISLTKEEFFEGYKNGDFDIILQIKQKS